MLSQLLKERNIPPLLSKEEMLSILLKEEYGRMPPVPERLEFTEERLAPPNYMAGKAYIYRVIASGKVNGRDFEFIFHAILPREEGKYPFFVNIGFDREMPNRYLPIEELLDNGFAILYLCYLDITCDNGDFNTGIAPALLNRAERTGDATGKIAMWAWGLHRLMDYAESKSCLDKSCACVCGHSRLGKTALLTGASDERFTFVYSNDSGCSGAALSRGKDGEHIREICDKFDYWFCPDYKKYIDNEDNLPHDQHYLLACCAPRYVYVASAIEDKWADPCSEYLACHAAAEAWGEGAFIAPDRLPEMGDVFHGGKIGYHLRAGMHYFSREDWQRLIEFIKSKKK